MDSLKEYTVIQLYSKIPATLLVIDLGYLDIIHLDRMTNINFSFLLILFIFSISWSYQLTLNT